MESHSVIILHFVLLLNRYYCVFYRIKLSIRDIIMAIFMLSAREISERSKIIEFKKLP